MKPLRHLVATALVALFALTSTLTPAYAAAGNFLLYGNALEKIADGTIDLDTDSWRVVLLTSSYTPSQSTHATWADASAAEASGTGYTAGGEAATLTLSRSGLAVTIDTADVSWTSSTITAKYAAIVRDADGNGSIASTDLLLFYVDLDTGGGSISTTNGTFAITINASGLYVLTAS